MRKKPAAIALSQQFHPDNGKLRSRAKMRKLTIEECEMWMAHGIMVGSTLQSQDVMYKSWSGGRAHPMFTFKSMREWVAKTLRALEEVRNRKLRTAMIIPPQERPNGEARQEENSDSEQ